MHYKLKNLFSGGLYTDPSPSVRVPWHRCLNIYSSILARCSQPRGALQETRIRCRRQDEPDQDPGVNATELFAFVAVAQNQ